MIEVAAVLIGAGLLYSYSSRSNKMNAEFLDEATQLNDLKVERDKDGAPMLGRAYQVFNERIELKDLISDLKSNSVYYDNLSLYLTAIGVVLLAVSVLQDE